MNKDMLNHLIERYYNGETSLDEEKTLLKYYAEDQETKRSNAHHDQFMYFRSIKHETTDQVLAEKLKLLPLSQRNQKSTHLTFIIKIAAALVIGIGATWWLFIKQEANALHEIATNINEITALILPDGSKVWLNERSNLKYSDTFSSGKREVYLEGEAYFEVTSNTTNPFIIHTGKVATQVVGTSFNLRSYPEEHDIELNVITGKVVFGAGKKVEVTHGRQAVFNNQEEKIESIENIDPNATAWKTRQLTFDDTSLRKVISDMQRYFNVDIRVETPHILDCHFSATFNDPTLEEILEVLSYGLNIEHIMKNGEYFIKGQNCQLK